MYTSLTDLGNISGNHEDSDTYGAIINEVNALTPYYERSIHYIDQKPWANKNMDKTYNNYYKAMNEGPVATYRELELKPIPQDKYEFIEDFCGNGTCNKVKDDIVTKTRVMEVDEYMTLENDNNNQMENYYPKLLSFLFLLFVIWLLIK